MATTGGRLEIVKVVPTPDFDAFVWAMFLMYARAPRKATPELDGSFDLGEIGIDAPKNWTKATPYSLAQPKS